MPEKTSDLWWLFSRQTVSVTENESVLKAALLMQSRNFRHLPVIREDSKGIVGIISAQDIIDSIALIVSKQSIYKEIVDSLSIPVERIMALHCIVVEPGDGLREVVKKLVNHNLGALPVVDEIGVLQGIITLRDLVSLMGISSDPLNISVSELMTTGAFSISPETRISEAVRVMSEMRIRRLPILSSQTNELLGMLTNKDILKHLARASEGSSNSEFDRHVYEFMTREVITISKEDDIRVAASRMMIFGVGGLAIDDYAQSTALITERDLIRKLAQRKSVESLLRSIQFELEAESTLKRLSA
ncbi:MAG: CBS domain-containing protein [Nitrososphaerales archaeon]